MSDRKIRILLVDDHAMFRKAIRSLIGKTGDLEVVGEAASGKEALEQAEALSPDVAVMDVYLPDENGIEVSRQLLAGCSTLRIAALSCDSRLQVVGKALQAGILAYVFKSSAPEELTRAIRAVMDNRVYLCSELSCDITARFMKTLGLQTIPGLRPILTDREQHLLQLVAEGRSTREIARALELGPRSVTACRSQLMKKLGCENDVELTRYALRDSMEHL